jgi:putative transposase
LDNIIKTKKKRVNPLAPAFSSTRSGQVWEHQIRDEGDYQKHMDYIHYNPVKHCLVEKVADWPHSTFHRYVRQGKYGMDWAGVINEQEPEPEPEGFGEL